MRRSPFRSVCVCQEYACFGVFDGAKGMGVVDFLREKICLRKDDCRNFGIVGVIDRAAHVRGLEDRAILLEESLVVSQMIRVDLKEIPDNW